VLRNKQPNKNTYCVCVYVDWGICDPHYDAYLYNLHTMDMFRSRICLGFFIIVAMYTL